MHTFQITDAQYDGSFPQTGDHNPKVWLRCTVDGVRIGFIAVYWDAIQFANAASGVTGVRQLLAVLFQGLVDGPPYPPLPSFPKVTIPLPVEGQGQLNEPYAVNCDEVLAAGSWTA